MTVRIYTGDCREVLATLPAESVQMCCTSPPYWGLRSYQGVEPTVWGGDAACVHQWGAAHHGKSQSGSLNGSTLDGAPPGPERRPTWTSQTCVKCQAWLGCLGLEPTVEMYVAHIVEVFRAVWHVLRKDGTLWLNLGPTYASHGSEPSRFHAWQHDRLCDSAGIKQKDSKEPDYACSCRDDESQGGSQTHHAHTVHTGQPHDEVLLRPLQKARDSEKTDSSVASPDASLLASQESTRLSFADYARGVSVPEDMALVSQQEIETSSPDVHQSEYKKVCNGGIVENEKTSIQNTSGKESSSVACNHPLCNGDCGICWTYYTIPLLKFKRKDLINIPHIVALALQADGWWLRSAITLCKVNPMPESCKDRPSSATEMMFLLSKNASYYYDNEAVREPHATWHEKDGQMVHTTGGNKLKGHGTQYGNTAGPMTVAGAHPSGRNLRNWWPVVSEPSRELHYAAFGTKWIEPCLKAGSSEWGCCSVCGAPWRRVVEREKGTPESFNGSRFTHGKTHAARAPLAAVGQGERTIATHTTGWRPSCPCDAGPPVPCVVLDPFLGSGTTALVAQRLGRDCLGIEASATYVEMARTRITNDAPLLVQVEVLGQ